MWTADRVHFIISNSSVVEWFWTRDSWKLAINLSVKSKHVSFFPGHLRFSAGEIFRQIWRRIKIQKGLWRTTSLHYFFTAAVCIILWCKRGGISSLWTLKTFNLTFSDLPSLLLRHESVRSHTSQPKLLYFSTQILFFSKSLSAPHRRFPHHLLILHGELCEFTSQSLVKVQVFGHAAVQAHRLALRQLCFLVVWRDALPVAGVCHPENRKSHIVDLIQTKSQSSKKKEKKKKSEVTSFMIKICCLVNLNSTTCWVLILIH